MNRCPICGEADCTDPHEHNPRDPDAIERARALHSGRLSRYVYTLHRTRDDAQAKLDDLYATGEIDECDEARVEQLAPPLIGEASWAITLAIE